MAVMPPSRYSAAPTQEDSPQKSMVQPLHTTLHAPQATTQPARQTHAAEAKTGLHSLSTSLSSCLNRAGGRSDTVISSQSGIVSLGHQRGQEGRGEAEDRRSTHLTPRARPHTSPDYDDPPTRQPPSREPKFVSHQNFPAPRHWPSRLPRHARVTRGFLLPLTGMW